MFGDCIITRSFAVTLKALFILLLGLLGSDMENCIRRPTADDHTRPSPFLVIIIIFILPEDRNFRGSNGHKLWRTPLNPLSCARN